MLFLTRKIGQTVYIGDRTTICVASSSQTSAVLEFAFNGATETVPSTIGETLRLGNNTRVYLKACTAAEVKIGIAAPCNVPIHRAEVRARILNNLRRLSIYEIWADPKDRQSPPITDYIAAYDAASALAHFNTQHPNREWTITPWVANTHWQPDLMQYVDAGMDNSDTYQALRATALLNPAPFSVSLPHLKQIEVAA